MNAPIQLALPAFLGQRRDFQRQLVTRVEENLLELDRQLARQESCSRLKVEGAWNAVIRVPATRTDEELSIDLLASKGLYAHPGHFYEFPSDGHLVVSLIGPEAAFAKGIQLLFSMW
jgi:alanine-synthesizing transaminase